MKDRGGGKHACGIYRGREQAQDRCFFAVVFVALALVPAGAHLSELANKVTLPPDQYLVVQQIYRGWALFGIASSRR